MRSKVFFSQRPFLYICKYLPFTSNNYCKICLQNIIFKASKTGKIVFDVDKGKIIFVLTLLFMLSYLKSIPPPP